MKALLGVSRPWFLGLMGLLLVCGIPVSVSADSPARVSLVQGKNGAIPQTVAAISGANRRIDAFVYKFDEPSVLEALRKAARRGVRIRIVANRDAAKRKSGLIRKASRTGSEVRVLGDKGSKLHAKFTIVDDEFVLTGSFNWTKSAARDNLELVVVHRRPEDVRGFVESFDDFWARAKPVEH